MNVSSYGRSAPRLFAGCDRRLSNGTGRCNGEIQRAAGATYRPGSELDGDANSRISPFHQAPLIDDDTAFVVAETAAIRLYLTEKSGKLIPGDVQGRTCVVGWCFATARTAGTTLDYIRVIDVFDLGNTGLELHAEVRKIASCGLSAVEQRLEGREWIACIDFTAIDIMMACVLRGIRKTDLMNALLKLKSCYERCLVHLVWRRTLPLYAKRIDLSVDDIRWLSNALSWLTRPFRWHSLAALQVIALAAE